MSLGLKELLAIRDNNIDSTIKEKEEVKSKVTPFSEETKATVLSIFKSSKKVTMVELIRRSGLTGPTIARVIAYLYERGLIVKYWSKGPQLRRRIYSWEN